MKANKLLIKLQMTFMNDIGCIRFKEVGVQTFDDGNLKRIIEYDNKISRMRKTVDNMKNQMKELESIYEGELTRTKDECSKREVEYKIRINNPHKMLE